MKRIIIAVLVLFVSTYGYAAFGPPTGSSNSTDNFTVNQILTVQGTANLNGGAVVGGSTSQEVFANGGVIDGNTTGQISVSVPLVVGGATSQEVFANGGIVDGNTTGQIQIQNANLSLPTSGVAAPAVGNFTLPLFQNIIGSNTTFLGTPTTWFVVWVNGTAYKVPVY